MPTGRVSDHFRRYFMSESIKTQSVYTSWTVICKYIQLSLQGQVKKCEGQDRFTARYSTDTNMGPAAVPLYGPQYTLCAWYKPYCTLYGT